MSKLNLKRLFDDYSERVRLKIEEKISILKINISINEYNIANEFIPLLLLELSKLKSRDEFRLEIISGIESGKVYLAKDLNTSEEIQSFCYDTLQLNEEFSLLLEITKNCKDGYLSVFFIESLDEYFSKRRTFDLIRELSLKIKEGIHFTVFSPTKRFGSKTIFFGEENEAPIYIDDLKRKKIISKFKESTSFFGYDDYATDLLPSDFYVDEDFNIPNINKFFNDAFLILCLSFLCNHSEIKKTNSEDYNFFTKINGYKTISIETTSKFADKISNPVLYKIYDWAYQSDTGNTLEKIGLIRNLISLHATEHDEIVIDEILWQAVKSNFKVYLQENVEVYLETKTKISEALKESIEKTQQIVEGVVNTIQNSIGVLITFLFSVVLINGFKDIENASAIFSKPYLIIVLIITACSWYWIRFSVSDAKKRLLYTLDNVDEIILSSYRNILLPSEINESTSKVKLKNLEYLENSTRKYMTFWRNFLIILNITYLIGTFFYENSEIIIKWIEIKY